MEEIYNNKRERIQLLTCKDIIELHNILCKNYKLLPEMEPISPSGVKSINMLESAVSRQMVGSGDYYKYSDYFSNCATLVFGLVKNHSFHNGNKRIGFLAMIKHLYSNGYVIRPQIKHNEIYELLRQLADSSLNNHAEVYNRKFVKQNKKEDGWNDEMQISYLTYWLRKNTEHKNTKAKKKGVPVNELEKILQAKGLTTKFSGKYLAVIKQKSFFESIFSRKPEWKRDYLIKDSKNVHANLIEQIRKDFGVAFLDGVDNSAFYSDEEVINNEIIAYKKIIYRLAKT
ncbi:MAG: type II toxin-antitoxin system death-on-curing family toxin [Bacteroidota bacterium]